MFRIVIVTPGSGAFVSSVTVPRMLPVMTWAKPQTAKAKTPRITATEMSSFDRDIVASVFLVRFLIADPCLPPGAGQNLQPPPDTLFRLRHLLRGEKFVRIHFVDRVNGPLKVSFKS